MFAYGVSVYDTAINHESSDVTSHKFKHELRIRNAETKLNYVSLQMSDQIQCVIWSRMRDENTFTS